MASVGEIYIFFFLLVGGSLSLSLVGRSRALSLSRVRAPETLLPENTRLQARCAEEGAHLLSIPRREYVSDCCSPDPGSSSLAFPTRKPARLKFGVSKAEMESRALRRAGELRGSVRAHRDALSLCLLARSWLATGRAVEACALLSEMLGAGLAAAAAWSGAARSCRTAGEDPTHAHGCIAQCFHARAPGVSSVFVFFFFVFFVFFFFFFFFFVVFVFFVFFGESLEMGRPKLARALSPTGRDFPRVD